MKNNRILNILLKKGFNCEVSDKDIKVYLQNYYSFRILLKKGNMCIVSFNGMKPMFGKSKNINPSYEAFIKLISKYISKYTVSTSGVVTINTDMEILCDLFKSSNILDKFNEVIKFDGLWSNIKFNKLEYDGKTCIYRDNKNELAIVREAFTANTYEHHGMTFDKDDVVLDLGANIGCFTLSIFNRVKKVIAVEPEKYNCEVARMNIRENNIQNCKLFEAAVVGNGDKTRKLFCGFCAGMYSLHTDTHQRVAVDVKCLNIQDLIDEYNPTKIKFDIKGSEIECVHAIKNWRNVNQVAFDYCFDINGDLKNNYTEFNRFKKKLEEDGFDITPLERDMKSNWNLVFLLNKKK